MTSHSDDLEMASLPRRSAPPRAGWITFRNVLFALIAMQITVLIGIGFSAPDDTEMVSSLDEFLQPAEEALQDLVSSLKDGIISYQNIGPRKAERSLDDSLKQWKQLSDEWEQVGSHDVPGALLNNFLIERKHPSFRQSMPSIKDLGKTVTDSLDIVSKLVPDKEVTPCQYHEMHEDVVDILNSCNAPIIAGDIVAYNSLPFERTWCGKTIAPHSIQIYSEICEEPATIYKNVRVPQLNTRDDLPPINLTRNGSNATQGLVDCDIPCYATMDTCKDGKGEVCLLPSSNWIVEDTEMTFTHSMLTPSQNGNLAIDPKAYRNGKHLATRSFQSEVPLSYFTWEKYGRSTPAVDFNEADKSTSFFKGNRCKGAIRADVWANFTSQTTKLVSYGSCFHNTDVPEGMSLDDRQDREALLKKHLFHLVIDSTTDPDFVDEAVWEALHAGVIPVYFGASNIKDHVPPHSIISAADYGTKIATAERINVVANDKSEWETYHEWRELPFPEDLKAKYNFLHTSSLCRMCRLSFAKKYGLVWDHEKQQVDDKKMNGRPCLTKRGVVRFPFGETWMTPTVARPARGTCNWKWALNKTTIVATDLIVNRTVEQHDGIIDVTVNDLIHTEGVVILKMQFDVDNSGGAYFSNVHQLVPSDRTALMTSVAIQDDTSRVTVLCDWPTTAYSPSPGIIQIEILSNGQKELRKDQRRRLRIIPEGVDPLRDVSSEYSMSIYSKRFIEDFLHPLDLFLVKR